MRNINLEEYKKEIISSKKTVVIDFYADWCGPCRMLTPIMQQLDQKYGENVEVVKVNVDKERELAQMFEVMSIPTVVTMQNGNVINKSIGVKPIQGYEQVIDKTLQ